ncbi:MAG: ABC transporter ATP-binding protein [Candidatus Eisenbacteria bacterium]|nr:ABC transporter ATP-binding protein [Candidatus Eisenbacteria bacterium]
MQDARQVGDLALDVRGLTKVYRHPWTMKITPGLSDVSFTVRRGEIFGYLGPNGAGKTTTIKILTGLLKPTAGEAWLLGKSFHDVESRRKLGFLPEQPYFYDYLNGVEYLELAARLSGLSARDAAKAARHWLGRVGLGERARMALRKYSKGMLQRLGLAAAMVHEPELLILDEPMSGLDPFGRRDVRDLVLEQRARGATVVLSSHILPDVEALCDRVGIVLRGKLERLASVGELVQGGTPRVELRVDGTPLLEIPATFAGLLERRESAGDTVFTLHDASRQQEVIAWLVQQRATIHSVTPMRSSLEDLFMAAAEGSAFQAPLRREA